MGLRRKRPTIDFRGFDDAEFKNVEAEGDYFERLKKVSISMFDWVNLPESMDERFLELCLFYYGQAALLKDEKYGFINTKAASNGYMNIYGLPTAINCYSFEYHSDRRTYQDGGINSGAGNPDEQAILVMNTAERISTASTISLYARRLAEADRSAEVNIRLQKFPMVMNVDEKQRLAALNLFRQYDGNEPLLFGDKNQMLSESLKAVQTGIPYIADKIMAYKKEIWNEYLTFLGINNLEVSKKERLVASEATTNNEVINLNLMSFLVPRQKAAKQFNELFGLTGDKEVSVRVRSDLFNIIKEQESIISDYDLEGITDLGEGVDE